MRERGTLIAIAFCGGLAGLNAGVVEAQTTAPAGGSAAVVAEAPAGEDIYATQVHPLLMTHCADCHGDSLQRGDLALHTPQAIARGGSSGPVLTAGKPDQSELIRRLRLPLEDMEHMPPRNKPQMSPEQIAVLEAWIAAGAAFGPRMSAVTAPAGSGALAASTQPAGLPGGENGRPPGALGGVAARPPQAARNPIAGSSTLSADAAALPRTEPEEKVAPANAAALAVLREHLVHVGRIAAGSNLLRVDFSATAARVTDVEAARLLEPVLPQLASVSLARCAIGDQTAELLARALRLVHLDLRGTLVTEAGVAALSCLTRLSELVLVQTRLTDAAVDRLAAMPALKRVFLWKSGLSPEAVARLRALRPGLSVDAGDSPTAAVREVEPDFKLTGDAPPPIVSQAPVADSQPAGVAAVPPPGPGDALRPVNAACPVSGKAVDPRYSIVHEGRVIGFCCPNCPGQFWTRPAEFAGKLSSAGPAGQAGK